MKQIYNFLRYNEYLNSSQYWYIDGDIIVNKQFVTKHLKKSNAACFYTPIVLKLLLLFKCQNSMKKEIKSQ